jgi:hypothetical protein
VCFPEERIGVEEAETMENKVELGEVVGFIGIHFMGKIYFQDIANLEEQLHITTTKTKFLIQIKKIMQHDLMI